MDVYNKLIIHLSRKEFTFTKFKFPKVQILKEKQEKARLEAAVDSEQLIAELNRRHEREKQILMEENDKLAANVEFVSWFIKQLIN